MSRAAIPRVAVGAEHRAPVAHAAAHARSGAIGTRLAISELAPGWITGARADWNALLHRSRADAAFMSWEWMSAAHEVLAPGRASHIVAVHHDGALVALLPLFRVRTRATLWASGLSLAAAEITGADYADALCVTGFEAEVADALGSWLARRQDWARIDFSDVAEASVARAIARRVGHGAVVCDRPGSVCPRIALDDGFERYLAARFSRKHRYNVKRQLRLAEDGGARLVVHDTPDRLAPAFATLLKLHRERKASQRVRSAFASGLAATFHATAAQRLAAAGKALVATLERDQTVLAAAYCLRAGNSLHYFQTGISTRGVSEGAGSTLLGMLIRWAAAQGFRTFDLLKGDEPYKESYATSIVRERTIDITPANVHGAVQRGLAVAFRRVRRALGGQTSEPLERAG